MERARGISITSAALQFVLPRPRRQPRRHPRPRRLLRGHLPRAVGRRLGRHARRRRQGSRAADPEALPGLRPPRPPGDHRHQQVGPPRPGRRSSCMDEIEREIGLRPTPLTWPVGIAGDFHGVLDRRTGDFVRYTRTAGGATRPRRSTCDRRCGRRRGGRGLDRGASRVTSCSSADGADHDQARFLAGRDHARALRLGPAELRRRPAARRPARAGARARALRGPSTAAPRAVDEDFSAFVFKVQSGMDTAHRDRLAYARVCSGVFERGMVVTHAATGRPVRHQVRPGGLRPGAHLGRDGVYPGDIIGLVNASALRVGDTIYDGRAGASSRRSRALRPSTSPRRDRTDTGRYKQFRTRHRAARPGGRGAGAALRPARRPGARAGRGRARCSSRWSPPGWRREFHAPVRLNPSATPSARRTTQEADQVSPAARASRCSRRTDGTHSRPLPGQVAAADASRASPSGPRPRAPSRPAPCQLPGTGESAR